MSEKINFSHRSVSGCNVSEQRTGKLITKSLLAFIIEDLVSPGLYTAFFLPVIESALFFTASVLIDRINCKAALKASNLLSVI